MSCLIRLVGRIDYIFLFMFLRWKWNGCFCMEWCWWFHCRGGFSFWEGDLKVTTINTNCLNIVIICTCITATKQKTTFLYYLKDIHLFGHADLHLSFLTVPIPNTQECLGFMLDEDLLWWLVVCHGWGDGIGGVVFVEDSCCFWIEHEELFVIEGGDEKNFSWRNYHFNFIYYSSQDNIDIVEYKDDIRHINRF